MKRDWDVVRQVLIEIEELDASERELKIYNAGEGNDADRIKAEHVLLLWKAHFLSGIDATSNSGSALLSPDLTWEGHDLLETMRSQAVWERIKTVAKDKGIELTFDAVKALGKLALDLVLAP
jgi:hypothetical protein